MSIYNAYDSLGIIGKSSLCPVPVGHIGQIPFDRPFVRTVKFGEFRYLQTTGTRVNITQTLEVINLQTLINLLRRYLETQPFDSGDPDCKTVLDQLYRAYAESHEADPPDISDGFRELETFLEHLPLDDNNAVFNLCCSLCSAYEYKAFIDGLHYGAQLMMELEQN